MDDLTQIQRVLQDAWGYEDQKFGFIVAFLRVLEQWADDRQVAKQRYLGDRGALVFGVNAADDDSAAILHKYLGRNLPRVNGWAGLWRVGTPAVLVNFQVHDDVIVRCDLRFYPKAKYGFSKLCSGAGLRDCGVRDFGTLLDGGFHLI